MAVTTAIADDQCLPHSVALSLGRGTNRRRLDDTMLHLVPDAQRVRREHCEGHREQGEDDSPPRRWSSRDVGGQLDAFQGMRHGRPQGPFDVGAADLLEDLDLDTWRRRHTQCLRQRRHVGEGEALVRLSSWNAELHCIGLAGLVPVAADVVRRAARGLQVTQERQGKAVAHVVEVLRRRERAVEGPLARIPPGGELGPQQRRLDPSLAAVRVA
mmetsp:Transcript_3722/g.10578  ORF Transcript_3722/g.10578 Transcript_3722/m.10578 type:complete len:214 (-) Transcript_3722:858-1499(-)